MSSRVHRVDSISFAGNTMILRVDGREYTVDIGKQSARLTAATLEQRVHFDVSPSGYGVHWPDIDEDLSIDGFIGGRQLPDTSRHESVA